MTTRFPSLRLQDEQRIEYAPNTAIRAPRYI